MQQAIRWNLFMLAQAAARADSSGVPAKGLTGSGYSGHYFWDTEIYVMPFLTYTSPLFARNALKMRERMLPAARKRARQLNEGGALFPWRTISGEEASAYYAAGTAQYHINADVTYAMAKYVRATGDADFLARGAIDMVVETARLWTTLGFWRHTEGSSFHIHGVTGPDEYTTVVNDNLFTNVMARFNLRYAAESVRVVADQFPEAYARMVERVRLRRVRDRGVGARRRGDGDPLLECVHDPPAGRPLPRPRGLGPRQHAPGQAAAAAALPPARHLPLPGAEAGRRRAGAVPLARRVLRTR